MKLLFKISTCFLLVILSLAYGCRKENENTVPNTAVDIYIYTSNPSFINLNAVGGWVYITGGVRGILVYRKSTSEFMAYDRNCTYQPTNTCSTIVVNNTNIIAVDSCCGSQFSIYDGSVLHGPAGLPLKTYSTIFDGTSLHVYN